MRGMLGLASLTLCALLLASPVLAQGAVISLGPATVDPNAPVEVTADSLRINRATGNAVFSGNVRIVQGQLTLAADEVEVFYNEDNANDEPIERVLATGNVVMVNGPESAEAGRAEFRPAENSLVMDGSVLLTQGRVILSGDRLVMDLLTGNGVVEGRVRSVLQPAGSE